MSMQALRGAHEYSAAAKAGGERRTSETYHSDLSTAEGRARRVGRPMPLLTVSVGRKPLVNLARAEKGCRR